jgi:hypothetical protein
MGRCIAALIGFAVPWFAGWVLVIIIAAHLVAGPIGWAILAAIAAFVVSLALLLWAFKVCGG